MLEYECKKCRKEIDSHTNIWNDGICDSCKRIRKTGVFVFILILGIIGLVSGLILGMVEFNYELDRCSNLKSSESSYDFDKTIELDANYNSHCYFINKHPLASLSYIGGGALFGLAILILIGMLIRTMWVTTIELYE